jgi:Leucine-rich repeat (LRR) protein
MYVRIDLTPLRPDPASSPLRPIEAAKQGISDMSGLRWLSSLTDLFCSYNTLTHLDLLANTNLTRLDCCYNHLSNLDLSANTNLTFVCCWSNPIVEIIVSDTNNLPTTFIYSGHPIIRQP